MITDGSRRTVSATVNSSSKGTTGERMMWLSCSSGPHPATTMTSRMSSLLAEASLSKTDSTCLFTIHAGTTLLSTYIAAWMPWIFATLIIAPRNPITRGRAMRIVDNNVMVLRRRSSGFNMTSVWRKQSVSEDSAEDASECIQESIFHRNTVCFRMKDFLGGMIQHRDNRSQAFSGGGARRLFEGGVPNLVGRRCSQ